MKCPYCGKEAELVGGDVVYPHRPDLAHKKIWRCVPCDARVGCHDKSGEPLGRLANGPLRRAKMDAHAAFDPLWKREMGGTMKRGDAYEWLAKQMGLTEDECHMGMFDLEQCNQVVRVCKERE
jgi:hypothetical protein